MPLVPLEFAPGSFPSVDESALDGKLNAFFYDGFEDEVGAKYPRPELTPLTTSAIELPVQGIFWSEFLGVYIAVGNGKLYKVTTTGSVTAITGVTLDQHLPAQFTENGTLVYVTTGFRMATTDGVTAALVADASAPVRTTHLGYIDGHVLTNQANSIFFWWADVGTGAWDPNSSESVNADIDKLVALAAAFRELYLIGTRTTEVWVNTGETPGTFQRLDGAFINRGCSAPYSVLLADNTVWWLDQERAFIKLEGRNAKIVSGPVNSLLRALPSVEDLTTQHFMFRDRRFILLSSRANNFSLVYDYGKDAWYQWGQWNAVEGRYDRWPVFAVAFSSAANQYALLGDDGKVYTLAEASTTRTARFCLRSAHVSHGTYGWKLSRLLHLRVKRGYQTSGTTGNFRVRWRDQGGDWGNWHPLSIVQGERGQIAELHRLGRYRTRQYEILYTDAPPFALVGVEEEVEPVK